MAYQVYYGQAMIKSHIPEQRNDKQTPTIKWLVLCCVILLVIFLGAGGYLDFLIPGDKKITTAAFSSMVEDVKEGTSVKDAFTVFCQEILDSGKAAE